MDLQSLRRDYNGELNREDLAADPVVQFECWMQEVMEMGIVDPTAMTAATVDADGQPSQRMVLLKQVDSEGLVFFTNYGSRKARELDHNPLISLHFPWHAVDRQVKICGRAGKLATAESVRYFANRPRNSQLAAIASEQSAILPSRSELLSQFEALKEKYRKGAIPMPVFWGGYRVVPDEFEFWQGSRSRLHDRFRYTREEDGWSIDRLAP